MTVEQLLAKHQIGSALAAEMASSLLGIIGEISETSGKLETYVGDKTCEQLATIHAVLIDLCVVAQRP